MSPKSRQERAFSIRDDEVQARVPLKADKTEADLSSGYKGEGRRTGGMQFFLRRTYISVYILVVFMKVRMYLTPKYILCKLFQVII